MRYLILALALTNCAAALGEDLLLYRYSRERFDKLLTELSESGIRRITVVLLPEGDPKPNVYGEYAMGYGGQGHLDLSLPNPAFFQHLDWVVKRAGSKNIEVAILPIEVSSSLMVSNPRERFFEWGRYLGRRYMKANGLVWLRQKNQVDGPLSDLEQGIRQFDATHKFELIQAKPPSASAPNFREAFSSQRISYAAARQSPSGI